MILIILKCAYLQARYCTCLIRWQLTVYAGCSLMCCRHYYHMALCMQNCVSMVLMLWEVAGCFLNSHKLHIPLKTHYENTRWSEWCHYKIVLAWQQAAKGERGKKSIPDSFWDAIIRNHLWNESDARKRSQADCIMRRASWGLYTGANDLLSVGSSFHDQLLSCYSFSRMKPSRSTIISTHMITEHSDPGETVIKLTAKAWSFLFSPPLPFPFPLSILPLGKATRKGILPPSPATTQILLYWSPSPPCCIGPTCWVSSVVHIPVSMETDSSVGRAIWTQPHLPTPNFQGSVCFLIAESLPTLWRSKNVLVAWNPLCSPLCKPGRKLKKNTSCFLWD